MFFECCYSAMCAAFWVVYVEEWDVVNAEYFWEAVTEGWFVVDLREGEGSAGEAAFECEDARCWGVFLHCHFECVFSCHDS